jgi:ribosomal protein L17
MRTISIAFIVGIILTLGVSLAFLPTTLTKEQKATIQEAIKNNNFEAWKNTIISSLTQENFNKIVERYRTRLETKELQNKIIQAIKEGNYNEYKEAVEKLIDLYKSTSKEYLSEEYFNYIVQQYNETGKIAYPRILCPMGKIGFRYGKHRI